MNNELHFMTPLHTPWPSDLIIILLYIKYTAQCRFGGRSIPPCCCNISNLKVCDLVQVMIMKLRNYIFVSWLNGSFLHHRFVHLAPQIYPVWCTTSHVTRDMWHVLHLCDNILMCPCFLYTFIHFTFVSSLSYFVMTEAVLINSCTLLVVCKAIKARAANLR